MNGSPGSGLIVVTAADRGYFPLLQDNVLSVRAQRADVPIGVLDVGLDPDQIAWLGGHVTHIVRPGWDFDFPHQDRTPEHLKAMTARPFLPRHFPGYDTYFWLDADAWMQDWRVVDMCRDAAGGDRLAIVVEIDRAYKRHYKRPKWFGQSLAWKHYRAAFGWRVADRLGRNPLVNSGVFALHRDAPHWAAWQRVISQVAQRTRFFFFEQIALNYVVFAERLPVNMLPGYCNWMAGEAVPAFDAERGLFVEPYAPHEVIAVMHLAGTEQKTQVFRLECLDGRVVETLLRYGATRDSAKMLRASAPAQAPPAAV